MFLIQNKATQLSQPQVATEIDWSNPITRGLVGAWNSASNNSGKAVSPSKSGLVFKPNETTYVTNIQRPVRFAATSGLTMLSVGFINGTNNSTNSNFGIRFGTVNSRAFGIGTVDYSSNLQASAYISFSDYTVIQTTATAHGAGNSGNTLVLATSYARNTTSGFRAFANGSLIASANTPDKSLFADSSKNIEIHSAFGGTNNSAYPTSLNVYWERTLSDAEIRSISANPWQIFKPIPRRIFVPVSAGGATTYTLTAQPGSYSLTGISATLLKSKLITAQTGSYTYTGNTATLTFVPNTAVYTLTAQTGTYNYSGTSASISRHRNLTASSGAYNINGQQVTITRTTLTPVYTLTALPGSYSLSGSVATILKHRSLTAQTGAYTYMGNTVTISKYTPGATTLVKYLNVLTGELLILKQLS